MHSINLFSPPFRMWHGSVRNSMTHVLLSIGKTWTRFIFWRKHVKRCEHFTSSTMDWIMTLMQEMLCSFQNHSWKTCGKQNTFMISTVNFTLVKKTRLVQSTSAFLCSGWFSLPYMHLIFNRYGQHILTRNSWFYIFIIQARQNWTFYQVNSERKTEMFCKENVQ